MSQPLIEMGIAQYQINLEMNVNKDDPEEYVVHPGLFCIEIFVTFDQTELLNILRLKL